MDEIAPEYDVVVMGTGTMNLNPAYILLAVKMDSC